MAGSLDIAAVLAVSEPPLYDFLFDLVVDPECGTESIICNAWNGDEPCLFRRDELDSLALKWASEENLPWPERVALLLNLDKFPWRDDQIIFYWADCAGDPDG